MEISKLLHSAILVSDIESAREFYGGILGLREKPRPKFDFEGAWYDLGESELHLIVTPRALVGAADRPYPDYHVALLVESYDQSKEFLISAGISFTEGTHGLKQLFLMDPDGNLIELQELPNVYDALT